METINTGSGYGDGYGYGYGSGDGSGSGYGYGSGDGSGDGSGRYNLTMKLQTQRLKIFRVAKGLRQDDLARKVGCSRAAISAFECQRRRPNIEMIRKISIVLKLPPHVIFPRRFGLREEGL